MGCQEDGRWKEITSGNTTGLFRYFVLFVIDVKTRRVEIAGINHQLSIIKTHPLVKSRTCESHSYRQEDGFPA